MTGGDLAHLLQEDIHDKTISLQKRMVAEIQEQHLGCLHHQCIPAGYHKSTTDPADQLRETHTTLANRTVRDLHVQLLLSHESASMLMIESMSPTTTACHHLAIHTVQRIRQLRVRHLQVLRAIVLHLPRLLLRLAQLQVLHIVLQQSHHLAQEAPDLAVATLGAVVTLVLHEAEADFAETSEEAEVAMALLHSVVDVEAGHPSEVVVVHPLVLVSDAATASIVT